MTTNETKPEIVRELAQLRVQLESVISYVGQPLYNPLEVGFRHSPLTPKETEQRYSEACRFADQDAKEALRILDDIHHRLASQPAADVDVGATAMTTQEPPAPSSDDAKLVEALKAGGPLVTAGYEVPAAGQAMHEAAARIQELAAEVERLEKSLRVVRGAAKTLARAHGTELEHLRQNATYDHRLRAEHESLLQRDTLMTDALEAAEARATKAEADRDALVAEICEWLRGEQGLCDCFARSEGECACGAWDDNKTVRPDVMADAIQQGAYLKGRG